MTPFPARALSIVSQVAGALAGAYREDPDLHPRAELADVNIEPEGKVVQTVTIRHLAPSEPSLAGLYLEEVSNRLLQMLKRQGTLLSTTRTSEVLLGSDFVVTTAKGVVNGVEATLHFYYYHSANPRLMITVSAK
jgi:hypothetical protein